MKHRIATLNTRGAWDEALHHIGQLLASFEIDVVALQECTVEAVRELCERMTGTWHHALCPTGENAILSRESIEKAHNATVDVDSSCAVRSVVVACLSNGLEVCCTHLEQREERVRLMQWAELRKRFSDVLTGAVLCADFNALKRGDYSDSAWRALARTRAQNAWEAPCSELMDVIEAQGFRDAWSCVGEGPVQATCRYDTRIDAILLGPAFPGDFVAGSYRQTRGFVYSDHELVVVDVEKRS